jgi:DNA-directed RNA polymerase subunit A"
MKEFETIVSEKRLNREQSEKLLEMVKREYLSGEFEPGELFGIIAAQSISEPATQMTMRTYHFAGSAGIKVTYGLPRLIEIFDARRVPASPLMTIFLEGEHNTREDATKVAEEIVERSIADESRNALINLNENSIEFELKDEKKADRIMAVLRHKLKKTGIRRKGAKIAIAPNFEIGVKDLQRAKAKIMEMRVGGIKDIKNAIVRREGDDWLINTIGSNLEEVLKIKHVDVRRTVTNDVHEVAKILGIEAARNLIIREALSTMQQQGLDVDVRHIMLVGDIMTLEGMIMPIGRYGVAGAKTSILARAAFEETIKHLVRASISGEVDNFNGIFENVMIGQVVPSGTGMFDLVAKFEEANAAKEDMEGADAEDDEAEEDDAEVDDAEVDDKEGRGGA